MDADRRALIVANMDTVGTFEMATTLAKHQAMVAVHKHYAASGRRSSPRTRTSCRTLR